MLDTPVGIEFFELGYLNLIIFFWLLLSTKLPRAQRCVLSVVFYTGRDKLRPALPRRAFSVLFFSWYRMKPSIFTPTHRAGWLPDLYRSLKAQSYTDFEWVIAPHDHVTVPKDIAADPRVKIHPIPKKISETGSIGAIKGFACLQCTGDLLIEVDHDDMLFPTAVEDLVMAAQREGAGFLYSDCVEFRANGSCQVYSSDFGWQNYKVEFEGKRYDAMRSFPATPSALHLIHYAPNHVRAWTRDAYARSGGHDSDMYVCDDHDLICRMYLAGVSFHHVPKCLYMYRLHDDGSNTYLERNALIQEKTRELSNKYLHDLIKEWCRRNAHGISRVSQDDTREWQVMTEGGDWFSVDDPGRLLSANNAEDTMGHIHLDGVLQQLTPYEASAYIEAAYSRLVPGGWLTLNVPSTDGRGAFQAPGYQSLWNENSFWYFTDRHFAKQAGIKCRFQAARLWTECPTDWHKENKIPYVYADLVALKGQHQPGACRI